MLRDLFPRDHGRYEGSRFCAELEALAGWLTAQGHLRHPLRLHLHRVRKVLDGCDRFRPGWMFKEEDLRQAFIVPGPGAYEYLCTGRIFTRFLAAAGGLIPVERTDALRLLRCRYHHYLAEDARAFTCSRSSSTGQPSPTFCPADCRPRRGLSGLTAADVEAFVQIKSQENKRQSLQHIIAQLRAFLRYCGDHGEAPGGLDVIDTPRVYRGELPPRALDWTTVRRLLASIWRRSPRDWRDYTVLHLIGPLRPASVRGCSPSAGCGGLGGRNAEGRPAEDTIDSCPAIGRPDLAPAATLPAGWQSRQRSANSSCASAAPRDKPSRGHRDLQLPGSPERSPARRCVILLTAPCLRRTIAAPRRRHQGDRRPA